MPSKIIQAVSFSGHGNNIVFGTRNEPISLSTLERDCFIIPVHSLDRFLPAGIPVSLHTEFCNDSNLEKTFDLIADF